VSLDGAADRVECHLADIAHEAEGAVVTKWAAVIEVILPDGTPDLWMMTSTGTKAWDTMGMLDYMMAQERAKVHE
jgi:hypothetical protein